MRAIDAGDLATASREARAGLAAAPEDRALQRLVGRVEREQAAAPARGAGLLRRLLRRG